MLAVPTFLCRDAIRAHLGLWIVVILADQPPAQGTGVLGRLATDHAKPNRLHT